MTQIAWGEIASADGTAWDRARPRTRAWSTPAGDYRADQGEGPIPVTVEHSGPIIGEVTYLERSANGALTAVARIASDWTPSVNVRVGDQLVTLEHDAYWSAETVRDEDAAILLHAAAITTSPARLGAKPLAFVDGDLSFRRAAPERWRSRIGRHEHELLSRAAAAMLDRRGQSLRVHDARTPELERVRGGFLVDGELYAASHRPYGAWRVRPSTILRVS
jgi:hypothetical protein